MAKFTEAKLEQAIIELLGEEGYPHVPGETIQRAPGEVLIKADLRAFLGKRYAYEGITSAEIDLIIRKLELLPASDLYPPVDKDEVYKDIFEQAESFK